MKIQIGSKWKNKHTTATCEVMSTIFYNVRVWYPEQRGLPAYDSYWHYKKFLKHWEPL